MKVLFADQLADTARLALQAEGLEVHVEPALKGEALVAALAAHGPDVLVVRSTRVDRAALAASPSLQLVVRAGAGVNTIDLAAASSLGIFVSNCPGTNAVAVAELTWGHVLNADRRIADQAQALRAGRWAKQATAKGHGLKGRTLGVLGCGAIGRAVIARALAFEMDVVAWSPSLDAARARALGVVAAASPMDVARAADVLTVHLALSPATRGFVGEALFDALRPGAIFVNTSRGEVVDEAALARAVEERGVRAGLDVFADEPKGDGPWSPALAALDGVYGTHHVGASTAQALEAVAAEACRVILGWARTGAAPNCVNLAVQTAATHLLVVRHADRVGVLAAVLEQLRGAQINVQQMENMIFAGAKAACARIQIEGCPPEAVLAALADTPSIYDVKLVSLTG